MDDPYLVRLGNYILGILQGDLGDSYRSQRPVMDEILARYPTTLKLTFGSIALGIIVGVIVGIISAVRQYSILDKVGTFISLFGVSAPSFWIAMMLVLVFSVKLNLLPATGSYSLACWVLPVVTLGLQCGAFIMRMTRSSMLEVIRQDYIRTARAKGQRELIIVMKHAFRNALVPYHHHHRHPDLRLPGRLRAGGERVCAAGPGQVRGGLRELQRLPRSAGRGAVYRPQLRYHQPADGHYLLLRGSAHQGAVRAEEIQEAGDPKEGGC